MAALLALVTMLAYRPVWQAGWVWDDDLHVTQNRLLWEPHGLRQIWFSASAPQYYPLLFTSFRLEYALWGLNAAGYHCVNILLHAASALLLWRVLRRLSVPGAWLAAAVFALHPVNVESVAWVSQRKNTLSLFFYLLSLLFYLRWESARRAGDSAWRIKLPRKAPPAIRASLLALAGRLCPGALEQGRRGAAAVGVARPGLVAAGTGHPPGLVAQRAVFRSGRPPGFGDGLGLSVITTMSRASGRRRASGRSWPARAGRFGFICTRRRCPCI